MARCSGTFGVCDLGQVCSLVLSFPICRMVLSDKHFYSLSLAAIVPHGEKSILLFVRH